MYGFGKDIVLLVPEPDVHKLKQDFSDIAGITYATYDPDRVMKTIPDVLDKQLALLEQDKIAKAKKMSTPEYLIALGDNLRLLGLHSQALEKYKAALHDNSNNPSCLVRIGQVHLEMYKLPEAEKALRDAIKLDKNSIVAHETLGNALLDSGQYEDAIECYKQLTRLQPRNESYYFKIVVAYNELGQSDRAVEYLDAAIKGGFKSPALFYDRAWSCIRHSRACPKKEKEEWIRQGLESLKSAGSLDQACLEKARKDLDFASVSDRADFPK